MGYRIGQYNDLLIRGTCASPAFRFAYVEARNTVSAGITAHDTDPVAADLFGRALTVAALMSTLLKNDEQYTLRWEYEGAIRSILVDVNTQGHVRGIPREPHLVPEDGQAPDHRSLFGKGGTVTVIRSRQGRILNSGSTQAMLLEIGDDMAYFLSTSDQVETELVTHLEFNPSPTDPVRSASGFLVQPMPGSDLEQFEIVRKSVRSSDFREILGRSGMAWEPRLQALLHEALSADSPAVSVPPEGGANYEFGRSPTYTCSCSSQRMKNALGLLDPKELEELLDARGEAEVVCEFCRKYYVFAPQELGFAPE